MRENCDMTLIALRFQDRLIVLCRDRKSQHKTKIGHCNGGCKHRAYAHRFLSVSFFSYNNLCNNVPLSALPVETRIVRKLEWGSISRKEKYKVNDGKLQSATDCADRAGRGRSHLSNYSGTRNEPARALRPTLSGICSIIVCRELTLRLFTGSKTRRASEATQER